MPNDSAAPTRQQPMSAADSPRTLAEAARHFPRYRSPQLLLAILVAVLVARASFGAFHPLELLAAAGALAVWPLMEWSLHRWVLHAPPLQLGRWRLDPPFIRAHRIHHRDPANTEWLFLPAYVHLTTGPLLVALFWWALPTPELALSAMAGMTLAALQYEWVHYIVHTRIQPRSAYGRALFRNHRMHHFRNEAYWYSFTLPWMDRWLGTGPEPEAVHRSETCRNLHGLLPEAVTGVRGPTA